MKSEQNAPAVLGPVELTVRHSTLAAFLEALNGRRGDLDAWLECNDEAEVRAHVLALVKAERERCASLCDGIGATYTGQARRLEGQHATHAAGRRDGANECAATIRGA